MSKHMEEDPALQTDNGILEEAVSAFAQDHSRDNLIRLMVNIREARLLVPVDAPDNLNEREKELFKNGDPLPDGKEPVLHPILVENQEHEVFAPAYTSGEQIEAIERYPVILNVDFAEVMRIASVPELKTSGILLNPDTDKLILHPEFLDAIRRLNDAVEEENKKQQSAPQTVRMTQEQFVDFARKNTEHALIPQALFADAKTFMQKLDQEGRSYICSFYRQPFSDRIPCPYSEKDFDLMTLDVDDETQVASLDLPKPQTDNCCESVFAVYNPKTSEARYFMAEKLGDSLRLAEMTDGGHVTVITDELQSGVELYDILKYIKDKKQEE